ncbi:MAG TPA: holo-ACP synthase [Ignavibacteria bacterium]
MIIGTGIDIVEIDRISKTIESWNEHFINKVFTKNEIEYCSNKLNKIQHYAARFAVKEAFYKALPKHFNISFDWKIVEVCNELDGNPSIKILKHNSILDSYTYHVSISHSKKDAIAIIIIEKN